MINNCLKSLSLSQELAKVAPGFYINELTPIEFVFDTETLTRHSMCLLLESPFYPTMIYCKFTYPDLKLKEIYPQHLDGIKTAEECAELVLKGKSCLNYTCSGITYYSVDCESRKITDYYASIVDANIKKYDYKTKKLTTVYGEVLSKVPDAKLNNFIKEKSPSYGLAYCDPLTYKFKKVLFGWNPFSSEYENLAKEIDLHDMIVATKEESARWVASVSS